VRVEERVDECRGRGLPALHTKVGEKELDEEKKRERGRVKCADQEQGHGVRDFQYDR
jgi:hypothetical protein